MSALAAGCRSGGRAGYSNAAVAYFVALAFGWAALEERVSQTIPIIKTEGRRFSSVFHAHFCNTRGVGRRCRAWRVVRLGEGQQDVAADSRAVVGSGAGGSATLWQRRVFRVALCPSN
jgi:hypothetical protein